MIITHFDHLSLHIRRYLQEAEKSIRIAVCWFTHREIYQILLKKLSEGVTIEIIIEFDSQNFRPDGLDFQKLIAKGAKIWAMKEYCLMHHKFAVIDEMLLITGSFNWTYSTNFENLLVLSEHGVVCPFLDTFENLKMRALRLNQINLVEVKNFSAYPLFEHTIFALIELKKMVSLGAKIWILHEGGKGLGQTECLIVANNNIDLSAFWNNLSHWNKKEAKILFSECQFELSTKDRRMWHRFLFNMEKGDLVMVLECGHKGKRSVAKAGVIQSAPVRIPQNACLAAREIQWLPDVSVAEISVKNAETLSRYRGSALKLLHELFT